MGIPTRADVDAMVREKLATDPDFREALLADPRGTLSALVGINLPDVVAVSVHEESLTSIHLVLPAVTGSGELADDELELAAGGACWTNDCTPGP